MRKGNFLCHHAPCIRHVAGQIAITRIDENVGGKLGILGADGRRTLDEFDGGDLPPPYTPAPDQGGVPTPVESPIVELPDDFTPPDSDMTF